MPPLHVDGNQLKDPGGNIVILHGYAQTFSPWFNERGKHWNHYDVEGCLRYNKDIIDRIMDAGWKMNFVRMHMDPYWSNIPGRRVKGENDISAFSFERFAKYLHNFSKQTQFIVITHRKPTMELADSLYGVTMEEKGVSKVVSVDLSKS